MCFSTDREVGVSAERSAQGDLVSFIKEHGRVNPGLSMQEARKDYAWVKSKIVETQQSGAPDALTGAGDL
jgi:hypothetical protein